MRNTRAGVAFLALGGLLIVTAVLVAMTGSVTPAPLALRVIGSPPVVLPAAGAAVSTSSPPASLNIPAIAVTTTLERLRLNTDGSLQTPHDPSRAGWYADGSAPGDTGAAIIVGHLDSRTGPAVFWRLSALVRGDRIYVTRADGRALMFVVDRSAAFPRNDLPSTVVYGSDGPELHLITCNGTYNRSIGRYDHSLVVIAKLAAASSPSAPASTPLTASSPPVAGGQPPSGSGGPASSGGRASSLPPAAARTPGPSTAATAAPSHTPMPSPSHTPSPSPTPTSTPAPGPSPTPDPGPPNPIVPLPTPSPAGKPSAGR